MQRSRIVVSGKVQGVYFRQSTRDRACELGLRGWVKNLPDGDVEILAEGKPSDVDALIAWCRTGPPAARVNSVQAREETPSSEELRGFTILY